MFIALSTVCNCQLYAPVFGKGQLFDLPFRDSEGNIQLVTPADFIQCAVTEYCSWFDTQGVHRDAFGNELWQKLCLTDNDISSCNYTVDEIEFVHKLYFAIVSHNSTCIPVGYDWAYQAQAYPNRFKLPV